uniref:Uncharacterized protein n=1 Tax=Anguilla anguilla TaxID=7936 RepID=A0A0E9S846_ANGAN
MIFMPIFFASEQSTSKPLLSTHIS